MQYFGSLQKHRHTGCSQGRQTRSQQLGHTKRSMRVMGNQTKGCTSRWAHRSLRSNSPRSAPRQEPAARKIEELSQRLILFSAVSAIFVTIQPLTMFACPTKSGGQIGSGQRPKEASRKELDSVAALAGESSAVEEQLVVGI